MTINGNGASISAAATDYRAFTIDYMDPTYDLTMSELTIEGFNSSTVAGNGAAVSIVAGDGDFTFDRVTLDGNVGMSGGAIAIADGVDGSVVLQSSYLFGNDSVYSGGAIVNASATGSVHVADSMVLNNGVTYSGGGGGIYSRGPVDIVRSAFGGNYAPRGGAISAMADLAIDSSAIIVNNAFGPGGAIYLGNQGSDPLTITNSTIAYNAAAGGNGPGGAIYANQDVSLILTTVAQNLGNPAALYQSPGSDLELVASVIANDGAGDLCSLTPAQVTMPRTSFVTDASCAGNVGGYPVVPVETWGDLALGDLQFGFPYNTISFVPSTTSPLVTQGYQGLVNGIAYDQAGLERPPYEIAGGRSTIGSRQAVFATAPVITDATGGDGSATIDFTQPIQTWGGGTIDFEYILDDSDVWTPLNLDDTASPITITALTNGQEYDIAIRAVTPSGPGVASNTVSVTPQGGPTPPPPPPPQPPVTPPSAPREVSGFPGDRQVVVSWRPPASAGSFPVTNYRVTATPGGAGCLVSAPTLSCTVTGLTNGTAYTFAVQALNGAGWGPSGVSGPITPTGEVPIPDPQPVPEPLNPGDSVVVVNGEVDPDASVQPNEDADGLVSSGRGWRMGLNGVDAFGRPIPLGPNNSLLLDIGHLLSTSGEGFRPRTDLALYLFPSVPAGQGAMNQSSAPEPVLLGTVETTDAGTFDGTVTVPSDVAPGDYVLQAVGWSPEGATRAVSLGVTLQPWIVLDQGTRTASGGRSDRIRTEGTTGGVEPGTRLTPWVRIGDQPEFVEGRSTITVQADGTFTWSRKVGKNKEVQAYIAQGDVVSNTITWTRIR